MAVKFSTDKLYFSTLYGSGIYEWTGEEVLDPLSVKHNSNEWSPLLRNILTEETYFMKRISSSKGMMADYSSKVLHPASRKNILWPVDILELSLEHDKEKGTLFVENKYTDTEISASDRSGDLVLLFPYTLHSRMICCNEKLQQISQRNWKNPEIRNMAIGILKAIDEINRDGYIYADFHLSRFFFTEQGTTFLNFSNLIYHLKKKNKEQTFPLLEEEYPIEFVEPAVIQKKVEQIDFNSQNYSLSALLFYLFFNRYAYDGQLLTGYTEQNLQNHYVKFRKYHEMPIFIFDPMDERNTIGIFADEEEIVGLWKDCPEKIKELFLLSLRKDAAERNIEVFHPTAKIWLDCLKEVQWM